MKKFERMCVCGGGGGGGGVKNAKGCQEHEDCFCNTMFTKPYKSKLLVPRVRYMHATLQMTGNQ